MTTATALDQARAEAFGGQVVGIVNNAMLSFLISIGHRTGLFDRMAGLRPSTSHEIAGAAGLDERYVREWLGAMTAAKIVGHDAVAKTYVLPPEHAASLTRAAGPGNLASLMQYVALMGLVEDQIVECFQKGGGVPYSAFPKFVEIMREESAAVFDATLTQVTVPMVAGLADRLRDGIDVADVGCGAGHAVNVLAREFPNSRFTGYDFSEEAIERARGEAKEWGLTNAAFELRDAAELDVKEAYDLITTFDSVHDQAQPRKMLKAISDALRPGGVYLCVDIAAHSEHAGNTEHPLGPMLYSISTMHCMTVSLAYGGEGLGTMWGEQKARELLAEAGFTKIEAKTVEGDILNAYYIVRK